MGRWWSEQLLLLARLDGDEQSPGDDGADASAAASQAVHEAEAAQGRAGRVRIVGAERSVPVDVPEPLLVSAIRNLLDNALRFAPPDTFVVLKIERIDEDRIRFTVLDRGPGLSEIECEQATERFWRRAKTPDGSGLGLAIVAAIAERHGGDLRLAPRVDGGLSAELTLPARCERRADEPARKGPSS